MADADVSEEDQSNLLKFLEKKETEYMRLKRHKMGADDFELLTMIGKGAFGEVCNSQPGQHPCGFCFSFFDDLYNMSYTHTYTVHTCHARSGFGLSPLGMDINVKSADNSRNISMHKNLFV